jgi:hypothetical protein
LMKMFTMYLTVIQMKLNRYLTLRPRRKQS